MKKTYQIPETVVINVESEYKLLSGSEQLYRLVGGAVVTKEYEGDTPLIPIPVKSTSVLGNNGDPFDNHGQGTGGSGTRSKGSLWDDDDFDD